MSTREVRSPGQSSASARERTRVMVLAGLVVGAAAVYVAFGRSAATRDTAYNLLPYQTLIRTLPEPEQQMYTALRRGLGDAERERARTNRWLEPRELSTLGTVPYSAGDDAYTWQRFQMRSTVNYFGTPRDPAQPAWILAIQEPEPNTPPDPAPTDDEHHRLPDGTTLHIYVWMHRYGGQVTPGFVAQPQSAGWIELFATPPNPVVRQRR